MRLRSLVPLMLPALLLVACSNEQPPPAGPAPDIPSPTAANAAAGPARFDGYGDLRFGMDEAAARAAWGGVLDGDAGDGCHYLAPEGAPAFMFDGGKFVRYDVRSDDATAPGGGKRGMAADDIGALYPGRVQVQPHKYTDGRYLRIEDPDGEGVLVFETDASGRVTAWRAGLQPQVDYVEGCS